MVLPVVTGSIHLKGADIAMNKIVYIVHGFTASSNSNWFPWLKEQLTDAGVGVVVPDMPNTTDPHSEAWLEMLRTCATQVDSATVFVGHSLGCVAALRYILERGVKIRGAVLVSGFIQNNPMKEQRAGLSEFVEPTLNVPLLKELISERVVITAKDDDIVPVEATRNLAQHLDAQLIELDKGGHFIDREGYTQHHHVLEQVLKMI